MFISVVIPTFNRAHLLPDSIQLLMNQEVSDSVSYEVVFVNNGSSDSTDGVLAEATRQYANRLHVVSIEPSGGPAGPRNAGIRAARGQVIIILDDDVLPDLDLVQQHAEYHVQYPDEESAAVGVTYIPDHMRSNPVSLFHEFDYESLQNKDILSYTCFWTCNLSIKRDFMLRHGMFDERFLYNEDLVCGHALAAHGLQLRFCPGARGQHIHQLKLQDVPKKGTFVGRWIWATTQLIQEPAILDAYGVISTRLGPVRVAKRLINRSAFRLLDNPITMCILRALGAKSGTRSRFSDLYYYFSYRKQIVSGYHEARKEARLRRRKGQNLDPIDIVRSLPS